jgi:Zn-dependent oligopeptidase
MTITMLLVNTLEARRTRCHVKPMTPNPLLDFSDLPLFRPPSVPSTWRRPWTLLAEANRPWSAVTEPDFPPTGPPCRPVLDVATERLGRAWGAVSHLNSVADTPELRAAYNEACPASPSSGPGWAPTSGCTPSTRPWTPPR